MKNFKYLLVGMGILLFPTVTNAATLTFEGNPNNNTAEYIIKYNPESDTKDSIKLKVDKTNDDLTYELKSDYGTCDKNLECTLITTTITSETTIATLTVKNSTADSKETTITIGGDIPGATKTFTLKAGTTKPVELKSTTTVSNIAFSVGSLDKTFSSDILDYTVTGIKDTINSVTVTPTCTDNCSWSLNDQEKSQNSIRVPLETGANQVQLKIYAENGTLVKTYNLNVYRGEITTSSAYLESLKIKDAILSPNFDSMVNDYTATVGMDINKLDISYVPEDPTANVEIKGNENLKEGENTITITVTSSDGENKQVYTIIVTKEELEEEKEEDKKLETSKVTKKKNNTWLIILLSILGLGIIITAFILIFKKKKNKDKKNKKDNNDKNNNNNQNKEEENIETDPNILNNDTLENDIIKENTDTLNILEETRRQMKEEPKQDIDDALDDLMKTKKLELGDLDF